MRLLGMLLPLAAVAIGARAQTADKPLTNSNIESMLVAGLPETTILMKIEMAAFRGLVDLDASSNGLIALKQKGASEQVLNAVMWAEPFGAGLKRQQAENHAVPGLPSSGGVYYRGPSGWEALRSFLLWPPFYSAGGFYALRSHEYKVPLAGSHADLQIAEPQPAFYLRGPASDAWTMLRVAPHNHKRLLRLISRGDFANGDQFPANEVRQIQIIRAAGEVYTLRPVAPLEAGEYVVCGAVPGGATLHGCYSFGIQR